MTVEIQQNVSTSEAVTDTPKLTQYNTEQPKAENTLNVDAPAGNMPGPKPSPAQDIRNIQTLLVMGVFPGQAAPEICKAYQLLDKMAQKIEAEAVKGE